jgi:hypothetical protein
MRSTHENRGPGMGEPMMGRPPVPSEPYQHHKSKGILGTLLGTAVASMAMSKMTSSSSETTDTVEDYDTTAETSTASTASADEGDYSMADSYPSTCPGCGAPTTGKRYCEYCNTKVY